MIKDSCGYFMNGVCTFYERSCDEVPLEHCITIKEINEAAK